MRTVSLACLSAKAYKQSLLRSTELPPFRNAETSGSSKGKSSPKSTLPYVSAFFHF